LTRVLVDVGHPAHYHVFKHLARQAVAEGHEVRFTIREKDVTKALMDHDGVPYRSTGAPSKGIRLLGEMVRRDVVLAREARRFKADYLLGVCNMMVAQASRLAPGRSILLDDTEHQRLAQRLGYPFCHEYWTPTWYRHRFGRKQRRYRGYHEVAYLHPRLFTPDPEVARKAGVKPGRKNVVVRIVSWGAHHDVGVKGRLRHDQWIRIVASLSEVANVLVSAEGTLPPELASQAFKAHPSDMHHVLAACDLVLGEGATMVSEAAVLGVPAVYVNPLPIGYIEDQGRFGLAWTAQRPEEQEAEILANAHRMLGLSGTDRAAARSALLAECDDLTALLAQRVLR
jgi:predicted glycosyltransferase